MSADTFEQSSVAGYLLSAEVPIRWLKVFDDTVIKFFEMQAKRLNSNMETIAALFLGSLSVIVGGKTEIKVSEDEKYRPNIYIINVADVGMGKTAAFKYVVRDPLHALEKTVKEKLMHNDLTKAGLFKAMEQSKGQLLLGGDEFGPTWERMVTTTKSDELYGLRGNLNAAFGDPAFSKAYGTRASVELSSSSYLVVAGCMQPSWFLRCAHSMCALQDGLNDRILVVSSNPLEKNENLDESQSSDSSANLTVESSASTATSSTRGNETLMDKLPNVNLNRVLEKIYLHHGNGKTFTFSEEAVDYLAEMRDLEKQSRVAYYERLKEQLKQGGPSAMDCEKCFETKDTDLAIKVCVLGKIARLWFKKALLEQLDEESEADAYVEVISKNELKSAFGFVSDLRKHQRPYMDIASSMEHPSSGRSGIGSGRKSACAGKAARVQESVAKKILLFPGREMTTNIMTRSGVRVDAKEIGRMMELLAEDGLGVVKKMGYNLRTLGYYKMSPERVDREKLKEHEVEYDHYKLKYEQKAEEKTGMKWKESFDLLEANRPKRK